MNEKQKIEQVMEVFQDYLNDSELEILYSEKQQCYICIKWRQGMEEYNEELIRSGEQLCKLLIWELYLDMYMEYGLHRRENCDDWDMTDEAKDDYLSRARYYLNQLPEYQHVLKDYL